MGISLHTHPVPRKPGSQHQEGPSCSHGRGGGDRWGIGGGSEAQAIAATSSPSLYLPAQHSGRWALKSHFPLCLWFFIFSCLILYFCFLCLTEINNSHCIISSSVILSSLQIFQVLKHFVSILFPLLCILWVSFFFFFPISNLFS